VFNFFRNLFRKGEPEHIPSSTAVETAPLSEDQLETVSKPSFKMSPPQLLVGTGQSVGVERDNNEDTLYFMQAILADGSSDLPFGIFVVADGMGGHMNGELASRAAARTFGEYVISKLYTPFLLQSDTSEISIHEILENGVAEAQRAVLRSAPGGGTTLTAALLIGDQITISHVGDSRAYFIFPDGRIQVVTQDHSLVRRLVDLGHIDEKEASMHPQRNVLYRALGQPEPFRPDINTYAMPHPGSVLICSDGLWDYVSDDEIYRIVNSAPNPSTACQQLVDAANKAGGPDNISVVLVQYLS